MDRKKVIKGLETCIPMKYETNEEKECRHEQCPYGRENYKPMNGCFWDLMSDALSVIEEQQAIIERMEVERTPSVVTLDVIKGRKLDVLWLEHRSAGSHPFDPTAVEPAIYYCMDVQGSMFFSCGCGTLRFNSDDYGWYWRCWTARPSEKMKKEVKWQEPTDE